MLWNDAPDIDEVQNVFMRIGKIKAEIRLLEYARKEKAIPIKREKSRSPWLVDEACKFEDKQIAELESTLEELEARRDFLNYHKELYKAQGYVNR